uniref:Uncharacterized protein n=1 Tax=Lotus japonicus TaxID=34305 RepID=I3SH92_LOTJA|nr:unknown [Lotus japonicus]
MFVSSYVQQQLTPPLLCDVPAAPASPVVDSTPLSNSSQKLKLTKGASERE